jgi:3-dehydroquinate dehydratase II
VSEAPSGARPVVLLLNGPNLNLLGQREPEIYGRATLDEHVKNTQAAAEARGLEIEHLQTNHEGELVEAIHGARGRCAAIVINPAAFTHYAWSLHDALAAFDGPVIEVHLSNPNSREPWRHTSVVAPVATGTIAGFGGAGYVMAVHAVADLLASGIHGAGAHGHRAAAHDHAGCTPVRSAETVHSRSALSRSIAYSLTPPSSIDPPGVATGATSQSSQ